MKIKIVAVGRIKEDFFKNAIAEYSKRLKRFCDLNIVEVAEAVPTKSVSEQIDIECAALNMQLAGCVVAFDKSGKNLSSEEFADFFKTKASSGHSEFCFLIGGSNGFNETIKNRADLVLSFGAMTFPHQLFRVMALEQIYRAMTIINGLPYHK